MLVYYCFRADSRTLGALNCLSGLCIGSAYVVWCYSGGAHLLCLFKGRALSHSRMDRNIADELVTMAEHDRLTRNELAATGALYEGYHPGMAAVHEKNALRLREIMAEIGWPTEHLVGRRAAEAAWVIA